MSRRRRPGVSRKCRSVCVCLCLVFTLRACLYTLLCVRRSPPVLCRAGERVVRLSCVMVAFVLQGHDRVCFSESIDEPLLRCTTRKGETPERYAGSPLSRSLCFYFSPLFLAEWPTASGHPPLQAGTIAVKTNPASRAAGCGPVPIHACLCSAAAEAEQRKTPMVVTQACLFAPDVDRPSRKCKAQLLFLGGTLPLLVLA